MFQQFTPPDHGGSDADRLKALRTQLAAQAVDGFIIPRADAHQGEYVPPRDERLAWMTGFTGSAGHAAILPARAAVFVDGRYTLQAATQIDQGAYQIASLYDDPLGKWLAANSETGSRIGYDPWLHGKAQIDVLATRLAKDGSEMVPVSQNPVDAIWADQPKPPAVLIRPHPVELSGEAAASKRKRIGKAIAAAGVDFAVLTLPDSIAWLLNIRGGDIPRNPVPLAFAILNADGTAALFLRDGQGDDRLSDHLGPDVAVMPREGFLETLSARSGTALLDKNTCPLAIATALDDGGMAITWGTDPCIMPKAIKNGVEIQGARDAHLRDGAAMARFLAWLDREAPTGTLTEIDIAKQLEGERSATNALMDISFDTISGAGPDGAIVHYRVTEATNRTLQKGELMLVDSGGQYVDGTTDITRTITVGPPPDDAARAFTLVLKGMIAVSLARFPAGTNGRDIDTMARMALWRAGMDYDHGTGHGIGSYLCVHEGPQSLSRRGMIALEAGMMCSNEPGYYRTDAFGIRIENLIIVNEAAIPSGGDRPMLSFETITLAPIDHRLIIAEMLTAEEADWLNAYHAEVATKIGPLLAAEDRDWLQTACAPL
ncbi:MAG: aminopeptidase P family protein [Pseudomonadota bacterium]